MLPIVSTFEYQGLKVTLEVRDHSISNVLEAFHNVMRGAGYCFDGELGIIYDHNVTNTNNNSAI